MFFSVASPDWKPGQPLAPAGALLFSTCAEAAAFAPDAVVVGVAVRHDSAARAIRPERQTVCVPDGWSARAVSNRLGGITVFETIPAPLLRHEADSVGGEVSASVLGPEIHPLKGYGWDSLTMALLA